MGFIAATIIDAREITLSQCGLIRCVPARASEGQRVPIHRQQRCLSTPAVAPKNGYLYVACTRARDPLLVTCMKPDHLPADVQVQDRRHADEDFLDLLRLDQNYARWIRLIETELESGSLKSGREAARVRGR
jgi:hypothetical protein